MQTSALNALRSCNPEERPIRHRSLKRTHLLIHVKIRELLHFVNENHRTKLLTAAALSATAAMGAAIVLEDDRLTALFVVFAALSVLPELMLMCYDKDEEDEL